MLSAQTGRNCLRARALPYQALLLSLLLLIASLPGLSLATSQSSSTLNVKAKRSGRFVPGEVLVRFRADSATAESTGKGQQRLATTLRAEGREIPMAVERLDDSEVIQGLRIARVAPEDTLNAIDALRSRVDVLYAEPNYIRSKDNVPNDPRYAEMWGLKNTGQSGGRVDADIHAEQAWDITTGSSDIVVGVVDEGLDVNHPDLAANVWTNPGETPGNGIDDDGDGFVDDVNGYDFFHNDGTVYDGGPGATTDTHGTHVAGTVGATGNNSEGVVGVNWQVKLMSLKVLGRDNESPAPSSVLVTVRALNYAKMMRDLWISSGGVRGANIRVLNNSYGGGGYSQAELDAINALNQSGILFVASAGNESTNNDLFGHYPAGYKAPNVISVMAANRHGFNPTFSNYGTRTVHVAAPGEAILSTAPNGTYATLSGTSMAAPHVSGVAALICAKYPNLSVERLRAAIIYSGSGIPSFNTGTGHLLNAASALQNAAENDVAPPAPTSDFQIVSQNGRYLTLLWTGPGDDGNTGRASIYQLRFAAGDLSNDTQFNAATALNVGRPGAAGTQQSATVTIPYQHTSGFVGLRTIDNAGNASPISTVRVAVDLDVADPYVVAVSEPNALSTGGLPLGLKDDDKISAVYRLPFDFPFFGQTKLFVRVSTNGVLHLQTPVGRDDRSSTEDFSARSLIAGMWDDLRTDRRQGDDVYVVLPDPNRVVFRWQAVTYDTAFADGSTRGENPVNFEIELGRDGTIQTRYGEGNTRLYPVVGISAGEPDAYVVPSHTSEFASKALTNAAAVTFRPRPLAVVSTPRFDPDGAVSAFAQDVRVTSTTPGALIHYTMNGSDPTQSDLSISSGSQIRVDRTMILKAKAFKSGLVPSGVKSASFTITPPPPPPAPGATSKIAYVSAGSTFGGSDIFVMNDDGSGKTNLTNQSHTTRYSNVSANYFRPRWSGDGTKIVFGSNRDEGFKIYVMNADGTEQTNISGDQRDDTSPDWSPDGTKIVFICRPGGSVEICKMNPDGSNRITLTSNLLNEESPIWSPDGKKIAYTVTRYGGGSDIYVLNADGTNNVQLTNDTNRKEYPVWSPDAARIAFSSNRDGGLNNTDIFVMNADGSNMQKLTSDPDNETAPTWSPDGAKIAFTTIRFNISPNFRIFVMNADGSQRINLTNDQAGGGAPAWGLQAAVGPPLLLTEENSNQAIAMDSVTLMRGPFPLIKTHHLSTERGTRIMLLARNVALQSGESLSVLTAELEDSQHNLYPLTVEFVGKVPNFGWLTQVIVKLPDQMAITGEVSVSLSLRGSVSNKAVIAIKPT
ncbi:MAG: S8 family serine peptidase [Pyrinomonadaceae bacterium]